MAKLKLTAPKVEALRTSRAQEDFWDTLSPGLHLRVSGTTSRKTWLVRYRNGTQTHHRHKLGEFPDMTLADARDAARDALALADKGGDPAAERRALKRQEESGTTFKALADEVLERRAKKTRDGQPARERTKRERRRMLDVEVLPKWGPREVASITRRDVIELVEAIADRGAPVLANRVLAIIRLIFNDGVRRDFPTLVTNPAHLVEAPGVEKSRDRYLTAKEIRAVWKATEDENALTKAAARLTFLTGQRTGSVLAMRWDGIDGALWTIPAEHFKGKRVHSVPLSPEALEVIDELREVKTSDAWVFPSRAGSKEPHITNLAAALIRIRKATNLSRWTFHDARTTLRTWATRATQDGGLGIQPNVADAVLGHAESSLGWRRYQGDRPTYLLHEKREALVAWGAWVRNALEGS